MPTFCGRQKLLSDSKLSATESPKLFATEKKSRDGIVPSTDLRDKFRFRGTQSRA
jgi:hypothetical protein